MLPKQPTFVDQNPRVGIGYLGNNCSRLVFRAMLKLWGLRPNIGLYLQMSGLTLYGFRVNLQAEKKGPTRTSMLA